MNILIIDHNDSFTWNIAAQIRSEKGISAAVTGCASPVLTDEYISRFNGILLSPGPGHPCAAADTHRILDRFHRIKPFLGVCLGHQIIASYFGGSIAQSENPVHGKTSRISHDGRTLFAGVSQDIRQMRYHSLYAADPLPSCIEASARSDDGIIMGLRHRDLPIEGVQFHPESVMSEQGEQIIKNWLQSVCLHA